MNCYYEMFGMGMLSFETLTGPCRNRNRNFFYNSLLYHKGLLSLVSTIKWLSMTRTQLLALVEGKFFFACVMGVNFLGKPKNKVLL